MSRLQAERPAAYIELMLSFESRKRTASPDRLSTLNIFPPFAFAEFFHSVSGKDVSATKVINNINNFLLKYKDIWNLNEFKICHMK